MVSAAFAEICWLATLEMSAIKISGVPYRSINPIASMAFPSILSSFFK